MAWLKLANRAISRQWRGHANEREIIVKRFKVDVAADGWMFEQGAEFRTKNQMAVHLRVKQRLLADAIARQKKRLGSLVPNCKREHAAQILWTVRSVLVIGVYDRFSVAVGVKLVAETLELRAQLAVVVNFAVENNPGSLVLIVNRLLAVSEVDY